MAGPGLEPGHGVRTLLAAAGGISWMLACFAAAAFMLANDHAYRSSTADAVGTQMGVEAALHVAGLLPVTLLGVAVVMLVRTTALRPILLNGNFIAILLGAGVNVVPVLPPGALPDGIVDAFTDLGGAWGQAVIIVAVLVLGVLTGLWSRGWFLLGRLLHLRPPDSGVMYATRSRRPGRRP